MKYPSVIHGHRNFTDTCICLTAATHLRHKHHIQSTHVMSRTNHFPPGCDCYETYYFAMGSTTEKLGFDSWQRARDVSHSVQTDSWFHPTLHCIATVGLLSGAKATREQDGHFRLRIMWRLSICRDIPPLLHASSECAA
jgi:hypothetical protein